LASARDARPLRDFAEVTRFKSAGAFVTAYQRAFGESPTATRVRAVRTAGPP
jgi:AraC-like DNA-binding protein